MRKNLIKILKQTGPLVAPSTNPEGEEPAYNIKQAKKYFGDNIDFYINEGVKKGKAKELLKDAELKQGAMVTDNLVVTSRNYFTKK